MGVRERRLAIQAVRGQIWSPGRPSVARREDRVGFWRAIARGVTTEDAAAEAGVSAAVGARWFRQAGGMPPISFAPRSGRYLTFTDREEIAISDQEAKGRWIFVRPRPAKEPSQIYSIRLPVSVIEQLRVLEHAPEDLLDVQRQPVGLDALRPDALRS